MISSWRATKTNKITRSIVIWRGWLNSPGNSKLEDILFCCGLNYKGSRVTDALVKTERTKGASSPGCMVVGTMV